MQRWITLSLIVVAISLSGLSIGLAQDTAPPALNAEGTPCASPGALVFASPGATMLASSDVETGGTPAATPAQDDSETDVIDESCLPENATPSP